MSPALPPARSPRSTFRPFGSWRAVALLATGLLASMPLAAPAQVEEITAREGGEAGLVVLVEPADVALATELAAAGRHLVVALSADTDRVAQWDAAFVEAGVHPVANAIHWLSPERLPFPTNKVNILGLDGATAERLGEEEIRRVIAPGHGFALVEGREVRKPRPEGMDVWLAYDYDSTGNRLSRDMLDPPNSIQFLAAGRVAGAGEILMTDRVLYHRGAAREAYERIHRRNAPSTRGYDPFSGVVRWSMARPLGHHHAKRWGFDIFTDGKRLFAPRSDSASDRDLEMMTFDLLTGEIIEERLPHIQWSERLRNREIRTRNPRSSSVGPFAYFGTRHIVGDGQRVYQVDVAQTVRALSADGTELLWEKTFADDEYTYQVVSDGDLVAVLLTSTDDYTMDRLANFRSNAKPATAIVGLDAETGELRWRYEGVAGYPIWFLVADFGAVVAGTQLHPASERRGPRVEQVEQNFLVSLDAATGKERFRRAGKDGFPGLHLSNANRGALSVNENRLIYHDVRNVAVFDLRTGEILEPQVSVRAETIRRNTIMWWPITTRWFLGDGVFVSYDGRQRDEWANTMLWQGYNGFAQKPANNMLYTRPGGSYTREITDLVAMAREEHFPEVLPDDRRLLVSGRAEGVREADPADWPTFRGDFGRRGWRSADGPATLEPAWETRVDRSGPQGDIPLGWTLNSRRPGPISQPVADGRRVLVAVPDRHELVCLDLADGSVLWTSRLSGRVNAPPTLAGDVAFVGVNDGTASAINLADGSVIWTFLAAPYERYHNASQQLESTHPVFSSPVLHNGKLYVNAGRHGGAPQGILVWALDPATGEPQGRQTVTRYVANDLIQRVGDQVRINNAPLEGERTRAPSVTPRSRGHQFSSNGWVCPQYIWSGYFLRGLEDTEWRAPHNTILTDRHFVTAGPTHGGIRCLELSLDRPSVREPDRTMEWGIELLGSFAHDELHPIFAGAGRYRYLASLPSPSHRRDQEMYISVWDTSQDDPELSQITVDPLHDGEAFIPDGIAIAHGHVIITTTEGRVMAFRSAE